MKTKPTKEGYYAWRDFGNSIPYYQLSHIYYENEELWVDFNFKSLTKDKAPLSEVADREWFEVKL